jgi:hypothetical protein
LCCAGCCRVLWLDCQSEHENGIDELEESAAATPWNVRQVTLFVIGWHNATGSFVRPHSVTLTLRPPGYPRIQRWSIYEDGVQIGRLYEDPQANWQENRLFWCIQVMGPLRRRIDRRAATLD